MAILKMDDNSYFSLDAISNSYIGQFLRCPAAVNVKTEQTPAMAFGSALHLYVLEGKKEFYNRYAVQYEKYDKRTKDGKAAAQAFEEANAGKQVISGDDFQKICGIYQSIMNHPTAGEVMNAN